MAGCGGEDFANNPRPPVPVELTGVIQSDAVTVSPARIGAGRYEVRAGSDVALPREIRPAELRIGRERRSSSNDLLLP